MKRLFGYRIISLQRVFYFYAEDILILITIYKTKYLFKMTLSIVEIFNNFSVT